MRGQLFRRFGRTGLPMAMVALFAASSATEAFVIGLPGPAGHHWTGPQSQDPDAMILAQASRRDSGGSDRDTVRNKKKKPKPLTNTQTDDVVRSVARERDICRRIEWDYRLDCLSQVVRKAREATPQSDTDMTRSLKEAETRLTRLKSRVIAKDADAVRFKVPEGTTAPLRPVTTGDRAAVAREADRIIDEATTELLRSAADDEARLAQYTRVVAALDSTKVLLRSA